MSKVLMLSTMCGHKYGEPLAQKMIDWVKERRRRPDQAVISRAVRTRGVSKPARGKRILKTALNRTD